MESWDYMKGELYNTMERSSNSSSGSIGRDSCNMVVE